MTLDSRSQIATHPLFVYPSDTSRSVLIPTKLTGFENYGLWHRTMMIALQAKKSWGLLVAPVRRINLVLIFMKIGRPAL